MNPINMKKLSFSTILVLVFIAGAVVSGVYISNVSANKDGQESSHIKYFMNHDNSEFGHEGDRMHKWQMKDRESTDESHEKFMGDVSREVTLIENGIIITITSDDPEKVQKLQEMASVAEGFFGARGHYNKHNVETE